MVQSGLPLKADVLKAGHHGSSTSTCGSFLDAVDPDYAVISCGKDNSYGHPHQETLDRLHAAGVSVFRTDEQGTVIAVSDGASISWSSAPELSGSSQEAPAVSYVLNRNTMKFHAPDCPSVTQMKEENGSVLKEPETRRSEWDTAPAGSAILNPAASDTAKEDQRMQERKNEREQIEGRLIVDRLEEGYAVCEQEDRSMIRIPMDRLPAGIREGE